MAGEVWRATCWKKLATPAAESRIWKAGKIRVFLSHKSEFKKETAELKEGLQAYGISCFVAHEDIHPTTQWRDEIQSALLSMDIFIALMTEDFHDSDWTDQEVGFAFGRGIPIIAIRLGKDPYGFIGKFQALTTSWEAAPKELAKLLAKYEKFINGYIEILSRCRSFDEANSLAELLPFMERMTQQQAAQIVKIYNENGQVNGSRGFKGSNPNIYGKGLQYHIERLGFDYQSSSE